jgi:hypothetical protein
MSNFDVLGNLWGHLVSMRISPEFPLQFGVTGSRGYNDLGMISAALGAVGLYYHDAIMHNGNCKQGADALCLEVWPQVAQGRGFLHDPLFHIYGSPRAYHVRNESIVARADFLLAFDRGGTPGTASTIGFAEEQGIPVFKFEQEP